MAAVKRVYVYDRLFMYWPVWVAARSKVWVCCHLSAEIVGSNPTGGHGYLL